MSKTSDIIYNFLVSMWHLKVHDIFVANILLDFNVGIKGLVLANYKLGYFDEQNK